MNGHLVADSFVSLAAAAGLMILILALRRRHPDDGLVRRLSFGLGVLAVMLVSRVLVWWGAPLPFNALTLVAAGLVPLVVLVFSEALLRRHAPRGFKLTAIAGALVFASWPGCRRPWRRPGARWRCCCSSCSVSWAWPGCSWAAIAPRCPDWRTATQTASRCRCC